MNAKKTSLVLGLVSCGAFALIVGCAGGGDDTSTKTTTETKTETKTDTTTPTSTSTSTSTTSGDDVTFKSGQAQGAMSGYGWIAMGSLDKVTSPTCEGTEITSANACKTTTTWSKADALCISGSIPALPASPVQSDYDNNWGVQIGVNAKEPNDALGKSFSSVNVSVSGSPTSGLRVMLHRKGDPDGTAYCATYAGSALPIASFNTACWDNSGKTFTAADATTIDKVMIQVPSASTAITVTDLCLSKITLK